MTLSDDFFKGLKDWKEITHQKENASYVIYAGKEKWNTPQGEVSPWKNLHTLLDEIYI